MAPPFTFSIWAKSAAWVENAVIFNIKPTALTTGEVYFIVTTVSGTKRMRAVSHGRGDVSSSNALSTSGWVNIIVSVTSSTLTVYLDGTKTTASVAVDTLTYTVFGIGCYWDGTSVSNSGDWTIAEAALWNFAVSDAEAAQIYAGAPIKTTVRQGGLCAYWSLLDGVLRPDARGLVLTNRGSSTSNTSHPRVNRAHGGL